ncbi:unnamed protein product [Ceratitis capitata]|uniref:(Mediterranean fruit fly) hypothetical protein n=1 Tax=Ceratitis capitata TaxID=7213 RepID=A0A811V231_CERCA|nr:unnamed protein product [Ceratitis capitata]
MNIHSKQTFKASAITVYGIQYQQQYSNYTSFSDESLTEQILCFQRSWRQNKLRSEYIKNKQIKMQIVCALGMNTYILYIGIYEYVHTHPTHYMYFTFCNLNGNKLYLTL